MTPGYLQFFVWQVRKNRQENERVPYEDVFGLTHFSKYIRIPRLALVAQWIEHLLAEQRAVCSNHTEGA